MKYIDIFKYKDYRVFLRDYHTERKKVDSKFSHRYFAQKAGYSSSGFYSNVVKGVHNITSRYLPKFVKGLDLNSSEAEYFALMIEFTHSQDVVEKQEIFERMIKIMPKPIRRLKENQKNFYEKWHNSAILLALSILDVSDNYSELSQFINPPIKVPETKKSLELMSELGLIEQNSEGFWKPTDAKLVGGEEVGVYTIHKYQSEMMEMASVAQQRFTPKERFITTKAISASQKNLHRISEAVNKFYKEVDAIIHAEAESDQIYQFNLQFFPLSKKKDR